MTSEPWPTPRADPHLGKSSYPSGNQTQKCQGRDLTFLGPPPPVQKAVVLTEDCETSLMKMSNS